MFVARAVRALRLLPGTVRASQRPQASTRPPKRSLHVGSEAHVAQRRPRQRGTPGGSTLPRITPLFGSTGRRANAEEIQRAGGRDDHRRRPRRTGMLVSAIWPERTMAAHSFADPNELTQFLRSADVGPVSNQARIRSGSPRLLSGAAAVATRAATEPPVTFAVCVESRFRVGPSSRLCTICTACSTLSLMAGGPVPYIAVWPKAGRGRSS
jgi:hypothetical protein